MVRREACYLTPKAPALQPCPTPGCPDLFPPRGQCPSCGYGAPWKGSRRREHVRLSGSAQQERTRRIIRRDGGICHVCKTPGADQADHVRPLSETGPTGDCDSNMAAIHAKPCHEAKTNEEAIRARAAAKRRW